MAENLEPFFRGRWMADRNPKRWASSTAFLVLVAVLFLGAGFAIFQLGMRRFGEYAERVRRDSIKEKISMVHHALEPLLRELQAGRIGRAEAIERARVLVRSFRYEDDTGPNYIFMNGMDGTVLVRPQRPQDEGTKNFTVQVAGGKVGLDWEVLPQLNAKPEGLFVSYLWVNPVTGINDEKVSFLLRVPELDVMIGTGAHMKEASRAQIQLLQKGAWVFAGLVLLLAGPYILMLRAAREQNQRLEAEMRDRLGAEVALRESEAKARAILDFSFGFIGLLSPEGILLETNQTSLQFAGATREEVIGRPFWECPWWAHSPEAQDRLRFAIGKAASGKLVRFEATLPSAKGEIHLVDFSLNPVVGEDGRVLQLIPEARDISDLKRAEAALAEQEQRLGLMLEATRAGLWDVDLARGVWAFNDSWARMVGYGPDELAPTLETWPSLLHPEDRAMAEARVQACLAGETPYYECEYRMRHKDGHWVWIHARGAVVARDQAGKPLRFMGSHVDESARREAEQALKVAKARAELYLETAQVILVAMDDQARIILLNRKGHEVLGYEEGELAGKDWFRTCLPAEDCETAFEAFRETMAGGIESFALCENHVLTKQGERRLIAWHNTLLRDDSGRIVGLLGSGEDITERRCSELEIQNLKGFMTNIIDSMPSILVSLDQKGIVTQWNRHAAAATGITPQNAVGLPLEKVLPDFAPMVEPMRTEVMRRCESAVMEKFLLEKDEERCFFDLVLYPLATNVVEGVVLRIEDVTERTRIQELMVQTEKMMSVGGLAAGMAHEINNPLGIISQAAQNIERRLSRELPANQAVAEEIGLDLELMKRFFLRRRIPEFLSSIQESVARASKIVGNMLQFSRQTDSIRIPASLPGILQQSLELASNDYDLKKKYDFRDITIHQEIEAELPLVPMVAIEVEQVIFNLLKNAAQAMGGNPPERPPRLMIRMWKEPRYVVLEIEDNGPGMTEAVRRRIFEPFFTTKPPGVGTGLGLSVSYMIITQNHRGLLEVDSAPEQGARFTIRFPQEEGDNHG